MEKMTKMKYQAPVMEFEEVSADRAVADTCWGYHGDDIKLYQDIDGKGWTSFQIAAGSCTLNLINVRYYEDKSDTEGIGIGEGDVHYEALINYLSTKAGGNAGNPYNNHTYVPGYPDEDWS